MSPASSPRPVPTHRRPARRSIVGLVIVLLAVLAVLVGCGDDDSSEVSGTGDAEATPTATTAPSGDDGATPEAPDDDEPATPVPDQVDEPNVMTFGGPGIEEVDLVEVEGDPLPEAGSSPDPAVGLTAPVVTASSLSDGSRVRLGPGTAWVIAFFAHWCPHCQDELPELQEFLATTTLPEDTEFVAVSTAVSSDRDNYPPSAWFNEEEWATTVLVDDESSTMLQVYGFGGFPAFVVIDAEGTVVARAGGNIGAAGVNQLFNLLSE